VQGEGLLGGFFFLFLVGGFFGLLWLILPISLIFRLGSLMRKSDKIIYQLEVANQHLAALSGRH